MKNNRLISQPSTGIPTLSRRRIDGFSLMEMLVALAVFLIISAAAFTLVQKHQQLFTRQQNQTGVNYTMRDGIGQLEIDAVNAGAGLSQVMQHPMGITVTNNAGAYDSMTIFSIDSSVPPANPAPQTGTSCKSTSSSTLFLTPVDPTVPLATEAGFFHNGDTVLLVQTDGSGNITGITTIALTKDALPTGAKIQVQHNPTGSSEDPLGIANSASLTAKNNAIGFVFCGTNAYALKLLPPITYSVDTTTTPTNPTLIKTVGGVASVISEQVVGFKVGASVRNNTGALDYYYNGSAQTPGEGCTSNCGYDSDWSQIRSIRVTLTARSSSAPVGNPTAYRVEAASVVINPRNLSMNDQ
jgi:prepilin-type N-terminal cleavage/methylation domain-containing protein